MFPPLRTSLLTQFQLHHAVPENLASDLYAEDWHTAPLMMMTPQKMKFLCLIHENYLPSTILMLNIHLEEEEDEEEDIPTISLDDEHWTTEEIPGQTIMHTWTSVTTWTMLIPVSICRLSNLLLLWDHGFKWHLQILRPDDHFQQWGYPCTQRQYVLKILWFELNIYKLTLHYHFPWHFIWNLTSITAHAWLIILVK